MLCNNPFLVDFTPTTSEIHDFIHSKLLPKNAKKKPSNCALFRFSHVVEHQLTVTILCFAHENLPNSKMTVSR